MSAVRNVLVVGGGPAGAATAILLAEGGVSVDLVDVGAVGSGITLQGNALRVLRDRRRPRRPRVLADRDPLGYEAGPGGGD